MIFGAIGVTFIVAPPLFEGFSLSIYRLAYTETLSEI